MKVHVATLFDCDPDGRLRSVREPWAHSRPPPRFFMGRTPGGNLWHFRHDLPNGLTRELDTLCRSEPIVDSRTRPPRNAGAIRAALRAHAPIEGEERGPAYLIPEGARAPADAVRITQANGDVLESGFPRMLAHIRAGTEIGPVTATLVEGRAVSICFCSRLSPRAAEAGVETIEAMRGRGHATAAVAAWADAIRERGLLPLYSTSWENRASQRIAEKLGMVCYGDDWFIE